MGNRGARLLRAWRTKMGLTQEEAAQMIQADRPRKAKRGRPKPPPPTSVTQYAGFERGSRIPGRGYAIKLLKLAGVPVDAWDEVDEESEPQRKRATG